MKCVAEEFGFTQVFAPTALAQASTTYGLESRKSLVI